MAGLERVSFGRGAADIGRLARTSRLPTERVNYSVTALLKKELLARKGSGYSLTKAGVEVMALKDYVKKDLIFAFGAIIAKGKESDVYEVLTEEGTAYALKFYKIGRTSFTNVRKKRLQGTSEIRSWMAANYDAARREYEALRKLEGLSPTFPKVIAYSRSTVLLEQVSGVRLSERPFLEDPAKAARVVFDSMRKAFVEGGLVNADLSEYNVLTNGEKMWLIDWPQSVRASHVNSVELLTHDVVSVVNFFRRAYGVEFDSRKVLMYVSGKKSSLE